MYDEMETVNQEQVFREITFRENIRYIMIPLIVNYTYTGDIW